MAHYDENIKKQSKRGWETEITFTSLLTDWLWFIRQDVKESTYSRYNMIVEKHICPELGEILLSELTCKDIDCFARKKLNQGNLKKPGRLSPKTVNGILSVIRLALNYGIEREYPGCRPIAIHNPRQRMPEIQIFTLEEQKHLEQTLLKENTMVSLGVMTSLYLGLRIGEICALRWEDLNLENGLLSVQRSVQRISNLSSKTASSAQSRTRIMIDTPKTNHSVRKIPIPSFMVPLYKRCQTKSAYYVLTGTSTCMEPRLYYKKYKAILKKCNLEQFNYHALRHTFATRCVESDFDVKSLSEILGHANVSTTLQRYVHPSISLKRRHMERLGIITLCGQES